MNFDFALILVVATALSGVIWLIDARFFAPGRRRAAAAIEGIAALSDEERTTRVQEALHEPVLAEYARSFFPVLLVILVFRSFIAEPFKIPSGSMMPTLLIGDFILVNKFSYGLRLPVLNSKILDLGEPQRGDVVVFRYPGYQCERNGVEVRSGSPCFQPLTPVPKQDYIKRVVGLPGDKIDYRDKTIYINGVMVTKEPVGPYIGPSEPGRDQSTSSVLEETLGTTRHRLMLAPNQGGAEGSYTVPADSYFVMGDNRDSSADSRYWGFVPEANLVGKAIVIWFNWNDTIDYRRIGTVIN